jgi:hypothetical protein
MMKAVTVTEHALALAGVVFSLKRWWMFITRLMTVGTPLPTVVIDFWVALFVSAFVVGVWSATRPKQPATDNDPRLWEGDVTLSSREDGPW